MNKIISSRCLHEPTGITLLIHKVIYFEPRKVCFLKSWNLRIIPCTETENQDSGNQAFVVCT